MDDSEFNYYREMLGLSNEHIKIDNDSIDTAIEWDDDNNCWIIEYSDLGVDFLLIHELGHIFLSKKTNFLYFATKPPRFYEIRDDIWWCHNAIIDSFVNFRLSQYDEINSLYIYYINEVLSRKITPPELYMHIGGYIEYYLAFNYILQERKRDEFLGKYNYFINTLRNLIQRVLILSNEYFNQIDQSLSQFLKIRTTCDKNEIKDFDFDILKLFYLDNEEILIDNFDLIYPNL